MKDYPMLYILVYVQEVLLNIRIAEQKKVLFHPHPEQVA